MNTQTDTYSEAKILSTVKLETPFGDVLVHSLGYELTKMSEFMPGFADIECPEQYVAEFVSGSKKGLHLKQSPKGDEKITLECAFRALMAEYADAVAKDVYRNYADKHLDYFA